ncbi:hypothetical protein O3M35_002544 [Rhynocoris fuscipes]|uniref:Laminin subunit alpha n=1 Tax=Rhynocoris fuscipes TaxID=488301 RepID=A0AAW1CKP3_9HEMI
MGISPRPGLWVLEKSTDYGKTYTPWQYFAETEADCALYFGRESLAPITKDDSVICTTTYSKIVPLDNGEIIVPLLNNRPSANDFFNSSALQEFTRATNVKLRLIRVQTLYGHLMSLERQDPTVTRRYFYSIKDISIGGRCRCNGHADVCVSKPGHPYKLKCECQHSTCGDNCEQCCENKVQKKWRQSKANMLFVCEECNCNGHSDLCKYNETVDALGLSMDIHGKYEGGGVCLECRDNTEGINCERCKAGYYRPWDRVINQTDACIPCKCNDRRFTGNCEEGSGICECKPNYAKPYCDACSFGFTDYPNCTPCPCNLNGTLGLVCDPVDEICPCRPNFSGERCYECSLGYYNFPKCEHCNCDQIGSTDDDCDKETGDCLCKSNFAPPKCNNCANGYYDFPECRYCNCDARGTSEEICNKTSGDCICKEGFGGTRCDKCKPGYTDYPNCKPCGCSEVGSSSKVCDISGKCSCSERYGGKTCDSCSPGYYNYPECLPCNCDRYGSVGLSCINGNCICKHGFEGKRCEKCKPGFFNYPLCEACNCDPAGVTANFTGCGAFSRPGELCECKPRVQGRMCNECRPLYWNLQQYNPHGCTECNCYSPGVIGGIAECDDKNNGQCHCKMSVESRKCNVCVDGTYDLQEHHIFGCTDCGCDIGGSLSKSCDKNTGNCYCKNRVTGRTCNRPLESHYYPTLHQLKYEVEDGYIDDGGDDLVAVRYGVDDKIFSNYSWKGYAVFTHYQPKIKQEISLETASFYQIILRYVNRNDNPIIGTMYFKPDSSSEAEQDFKVLFKPTIEPEFVTVSGAAGKIPLPFIVADRGKWEVIIEIKQNLLLDYFVLMPASYYEGNILIDYIRKPCNIGQKDPCLLYKYPSIRQFDGVHGNWAFISKERDPVKEFYDDEAVLNELNVTPMPLLSSQQPEISYEINVKEDEPFLLLIDYVTLPDRNVSTETDVTLENGRKEENGRIKFNSCPYNWLCRQAVIDNLGKLAIFTFNDLPVILTLKDNSAPDVAIEAVTAVPLKQWSYNLIEPSQVCIMKNGECQPSQYPIPIDIKRIDFEGNNTSERDTEPIPDYVNNVANIAKVLDEKHLTINVTGKVAAPGAYIIIAHYYQPDFPAFDINATIHNVEEFNTDVYNATLPLEHCPSRSGCRSILHDNTGNSVFNLNSNFSLLFKNYGNGDKNVWLDYILIIPENKFKDHLITEEPLNIVDRFRKECGQNSYYMDNSTSDFCKEVTFSLTTNFNNGALKCECDPEGSLNLRCEKFGGQCKCRDNVIGRKCEVCKTGYYGFPYCKPCDCPQSATCETTTGECSCPPNVIGELCDECERNSWGYDPINGCEECKCDIRGVVGGNLQCDQLTGNCQCKPNIDGKKCNTCKHGYHNFPRCEKCDCDIRGSTDVICDPNNAECFCKRNVEGPACDLCVDGTFNIQHKNKDGCTDCFCFNRTRHCSSSRLFKSSISGMEDWRLATVKLKKSAVSIKIEDVPVQRPEIVTRDSIGVDLTHEFFVDQVVFFSAPEKYLKNRLTSYGGNLSYSIFCTTGVSGVSVSSADVILVGPEGLQLLHFSVEQPAQSEFYEMVVELTESNFVLPNLLKSTREQFMQVLQDLRGIYIRATYWEKSVTSRLSDIILDSASDEDLGSSKLVMSVEQCVCPQNYIGLSCEECAPGYYRSSTGSYGGFCVPCQCNNHADICDKTTGKCIGCRDNTTGDHCEKCAVGYHGDATYGSPNDCLICACPLPTPGNNFATSCMVSDDGEDITCECKEGYYGYRCESCAVGYFGSPITQGESCKPCECSGNIDVNEVGACDSVTGECIKCKNNTSGPACNICKPGFFGDAVNKKNCQSCNCDKCGFANCDHDTGTCVCHPNVVSERCDRCADNYYGFNSCEGCKACNCGAASESSQCDGETGQCKCKPGVTGRTCDKCEQGYWNYTSEGCTVCSCNIGLSIGASCDPETGTCQCLPGVIGDKCERCPHRWVFNKTEGCFECDKCVHDLLDMVDVLHDELKEVSSEFESVARSYYTKKRLQFINDTVNELVPKINELGNSRVNIVPINNEFNELEESVDRILRKNKYSLEKVNGTMTEYLEGNAKKELNEFNNIIKNARQVVLDVGEIAKGFHSGVGTNTDYDEDLQEAKNILNQLQSLTPELKKEDVDKEYVERANEVFNNITKYKEPIDKREKDLIDLDKRIKVLDNRLTDLNDHALNTRKKVQELNEDNKKLRDKKAHISDTIDTILKLNADSEQSLKNTSEILGNISLILSQTNADLLIKLKDEKVNWDLLSELMDTKNSKFDDLDEVTELVQQAKDKSYDLEQQAEVLTSSAKQYQQDTNAVQAYKNIVDTVRDAYIMSENARNIADNATNLTSGIGADAVKSKELSTDLETKANEVLDITKNEVEPLLADEQEKLEQIANSRDQARKDLEGIKSILSKTQVGERNQDVLQTALEANDEAEIVKDGIANIVSDLPYKKKVAASITQDKQQSDSYVTGLKQHLKQVDAILPEIITLEQNLRDRPNELESTGNDIKDKLEKLKQQVDKARELVNSIKVGVSFFHNTTLELRNPSSLPEQGINNYASLYFNTTDPNGLLFFLGNEKKVERRSRRSFNTNDFMALEVQNGLLKFTVDLGSGASSIISDKFVSDGHWYQTIAERTGKSIRLSVRIPSRSTNADVEVKEGVLKGTSTVLNLDRKTSKLFIGGFPSSFNAPDDITYNSFSGHIEEVFLGGSPISLWNFEESKNLLPSLERDELINITTTTGFRFNGNGYVALDSKPYRMGRKTEVTLSFKTFAKDGLLFLAEKDSSYLSIEIREGRVLYQFDLGDGLATMVTSKAYNDGEWHQVQTSRQDKGGSLTVDGSLIQQAEVPGRSTRLQVPPVVYIGGYPNEHNILEVTNADFDGCIDEVAFDSSVDLNKNIEAIGVIAGCPEKVASVVSFEEGARGYVLQPKISATNNMMELILRFKTSAKSGLLAYAVDGLSSISLWLENGQLLFTNGDDFIKSTSSNTYNDSMWHVVMATYDSDSLKMFIDDVETYSSTDPVKPIRLLHGDLYFGGVPSSVDAAAAIKPQFSGCISDATLNGVIINFGNLTETPGALVGKCVLNLKPRPRPRPLPPPLRPTFEVTEGPPTTDTVAVPPPFERPDIGRENCKLPLYAAEPAVNDKTGFRFGSSFGSRFEYGTIPAKVKNRYEFSIDIKTVANDGIIFFAMHNKNADFIALYLKDGMIHYGFDCGSGEAHIESDRVVNDNQWHKIGFKRQAENGQLIIDDYVTAEGSSRGNTKTLNVTPPFYVGGLDPKKFINEPPIGLKGVNASFEGCLRNFRVNGHEIVNPVSFGVLPCVDTIEDGIYFTPVGGYVKQRERFKVGTKFEVELKIKPRALSGLLLSIHGRKDYFVLELVNGTVRMSVENGVGEITSTYIPSDTSLLCDGYWHTIKAIKSKHVITLGVDNDFKDPVHGKRSPSVDTQHTLYLGGHPNPQNLPGILSPFPYVGCMKDIKLNSVLDPILIRNSVGNVTFNACPTI